MEIDCLSNIKDIREGDWAIGSTAARIRIFISGATFINASGLFGLLQADSE